MTAFWYERDLTGRDLRQVNATTLADIIRRNTTTTNLQDNVFFFHNSIAGKIFLDGNENGRLNRGERGLAGIIVELQDLDGNVIASTITASDGRYSFDGLDLGVYRVRVTLPNTMRQTSYHAAEIDLTRGEKVPTIDIGVAMKHRHRPSFGWRDQAIGQALDAVSSEIESLTGWPKALAGTW